MMIFQSVKMAWHAVTSNKLRTFLTMLGIIIGVVALVVLVSMADGAASSVTEQISDIGSSFLTVSITDDKENPLQLKEMADFTQDEEVEAVAPVSRTSVTGKSGYTSGTMTITGTTGGYAQIQGLELSSGRFIKNADVENNSYVIVITKDTAVEFFGRADAAGETLSVDGRKFQVIGVTEEDSTSSMMGSMSSSEDSSVNLSGYIPFSTMTRIADNVRDVTQFYASSADTTTQEYAEEALTQRLLDRFKEDEEAFTITDQSQIMEAMEEVTGTMTLMLGGIAAISLLVGGIGIMNIMLVSVTERTREIGIRKAIGAGNGTILFQFLLEALMVSLIGCMAGIGVSWVILRVAEQVMGGTMQFAMSRQIVGVSVAFSVFIGIVFGIYPAKKAAGKKPIDALRYSG